MTEGLVTGKRVRFYFAYNSPYSFLASTRIEETLAPLHVGLDYRPVYQRSNPVDES